MQASINPGPYTNSCQVYSNKPYYLFNPRISPDFLPFSSSWFDSKINETIDLKMQTRISLFPPQFSQIKACRTMNLCPYNHYSLSSGQTQWHPNMKLWPTVLQSPTAEFLQGKVHSDFPLWFPSIFNFLLSSSISRHHLLSPWIRKEP